ERALEGTGIPLRFATIGDRREPSQEVEDNLLRICEEAITNAVKHAAPDCVSVTVEYNTADLRLRVLDNGCGFEPDNLDGPKHGHFGLAGLRERTKTIGGNLSVVSSPGKGTEVLVTVCWPPQS